MIYVVTLLLLAIPVGLLVAWLTRDELIAGRTWFQRIVSGSFVLALTAFASGWKAEASTLLFLSIIAFISYVKSFDSIWTKRRA